MWKKKTAALSLASKEGRQTGQDIEDCDLPDDDGNISGNKSFFGYIHLKIVFSLNQASANKHQGIFYPNLKIRVGMGKIFSWYRSKPYLKTYNVYTKKSQIRRKTLKVLLYFKMRKLHPLKNKQLKMRMILMKMILTCWMKVAQI